MKGQSYDCSLILHRTDNNFCKKYFSNLGRTRANLYNEDGGSADSHPQKNTKRVNLFHFLQATYLNYK